MVLLHLVTLKASKSERKKEIEKERRYIYKDRLVGTKCISVC
jgi:hypothetical protein